ncbi:MAG: DinB family protein [Caldilineaceae bacterium]|nr:DinB family protein [Caldilineaceae bacterium]
MTSQAIHDIELGNGAGEVTPPHSGVDRAVLQAELEATRIAFQTFLTALTAEQWRGKSATSAWTMAEIAVHLTWALEQLPQEIASARRGKGMFNAPKSLQPLVDSLSYWYVRWLARKATPETIGHRYDAAMNAMLRTLAEVQEEDWARSAPFYGHGFYTIAELFHTPTAHLAEHTALQ